MNALGFLPVVMVGALVAVPILYVTLTYNRLVTLRNHIRDAWANIDTELARRYDLIPNLVATVKAYAAHERETIRTVMELRRACMEIAHDPARKGAAESELGAAVGTLIVRVEGYPELRSDRQFLRLQRELVNTEDRIQAARCLTNGNVPDDRNTCESFPSSLVAAAFGFETEDELGVEDRERDAPDVPFAPPGP